VPVVGDAQHRQGEGLRLLDEDLAVTIPAKIRLAAPIDNLARLYLVALDQLAVHADAVALRAEESDPERRRPLRLSLDRAVLRAEWRAEGRDARLVVKPRLDPHRLGHRHRAVGRDRLRRVAHPLALEGRHLEGALLEGRLRAVEHVDLLALQVIEAGDDAGE